ncbi:MAG: TetR/AcrR family transcriptional regulator [bacterium]|nr:TetR/AcrR family transcriptional regulator [bacterium]
MGKKLGLTLQDVIMAAAEIADKNGLEAASLRAVADELGIKTPSLYNHVNGLAGLRRELALYGAKHLAEVVTGARGEGEPVELVRRSAHAYRRFALKHQGLYQAMFPAPRPGEDDELYEAMAAPVATLTATLVDAGIDEGETVHVIRALRAVVHGFIDLETKDGFGMPIDVDVSFEKAVDTVLSGVFVEAH